MSLGDQLERDRRRDKAHAAATRLARYFADRFCVYSLDFDGGRYIGSTNNLRRRWGEHERELEAGEHHNSAMKHLDEWALVTPTVLAVAESKKSMQRLEGWFIRNSPCVNDEGAGTRAGIVTDDEVQGAIAEAERLLSLAKIDENQGAGDQRNAQRAAPPLLSLPPLPDSPRPATVASRGVTDGQARAARRELALRAGRQSLEAFVRLAWPLLNPGTEMVWADWMSDLCRHLEAVSTGRLQCLVANFPPGYSKTTICSVCWPAWHWGREGATSRWWFGTWSELNGRDQQKMRRDLVTSPLFRAIFRPTWRLKEDSNSTKWFKSTALGWFRHTTPLARDATGAHGDYMVLDDIVPASAAFTDEALTVRQWWTGTMESRARDRANVRKVYIGQRICPLDLCELWRENGEVSADFVLAAEFDPALVQPPTPLGFVDRRTVAGEPLFPARVSASGLAKIKATVPAAVWAAQYQQSPGTGEAMRFPANNIHAWHTLPSTPAEEYIGAFDTAGGQSAADQRKKDADWNVGQLWGRWGSHFYLVEQVRNREEFANFADTAEAFIARHPEAKGWVIEGRSTGSPLKSELDRRFLAAWRAGQLPPHFQRPPELERKPVQSNKEARIFASTVHYEQNRVFVPGSVLAEYKAEAMSWPKGRHDDQIDCAACALDCFTPAASHRPASSFALRVGVRRN